ncbi:MAG: hemolysin family protein [Nakamurella sp.]
MLVAWILLVVGIALIALTAVYVAAEFSLVTADRAAIDRAVAEGDHRLVRVQRALRHLSTQLSGAQVGITVTTLALGYVMEPSLAALLTGPLADLGLGDATASTIAVAISLAVATVLSMVFGELVPKNIAIARPLATVRRVAGINSATTLVGKPLIWLLNGTANAVLRVSGIQPTEELASARTAQELESLVRRSGAYGLIESGSARLVAQTLRFSTKMADDVITPRVDIVAVNVDDPATVVIDAAVACGRSRFPVVDGGIDDVVGVVHVKRAVAIPVDQRGHTPVRSLMVDMPRVPGTVPLDDLLVTLRGRGLQMAVVVDEYGGTAGIATLEDVVEELIGDIADEHDDGAIPWQRLPDGALRISGSLRPDEIAEFTGLLLPDPQDYDTVAGLIIELLGRVPTVGDTAQVTATLRADARLGAEPGAAPIEPDTQSDIARMVDVRMTVTSMVGRRVESLEIRATDTSLSARNSAEDV